MGDGARFAAPHASRRTPHATPKGGSSSGRVPFQILTCQRISFTKLARPRGRPLPVPSIRSTVVSCCDKNLCRCFGAPAAGSFLIT